MQSLRRTLLAVAVLGLAGCDSAAEREAERRASVAERQAQATADAMANRAGVLENRAEALPEAGGAAVKAEARTLQEQADKTEAVVDELGDRIENAAR